jgi:hypothetical protein
MTKLYLNIVMVLLTLNGLAQTDTTKTDSIQIKVLIVPYASFMYFSDADPHISSVSNLTESKVRNELRNELESNIYHQFLSRFDAISLMRSSTLGGEEDLKRIYAATRYLPLKKSDIRPTEKGEKMKNFTLQNTKKDKNSSFWTSDSSVMVADLGDRELLKDLAKKYNHNYIVFITQFEINTNNKNMIEWQKKDYQRNFTIHYNVFDRSGELIRAEMMTVKGGNDNTINSISSKYFIPLAQKLRDTINILY